MDRLRFTEETKKILKLARAGLCIRVMKRETITLMRAVKRLWIA